jgi:hypothetical protein
MARKDEAKGEVIYEEDFTARVNKEGDTEEVILRGSDSAHTLVLWPKGAKRNKFKSGHPAGYRVVVIENPLPEAEVAEEVKA